MYHLRQTPCTEGGHEHRGPQTDVVACSEAESLGFFCYGGDALTEAAHGFASHNGDD